MSERYQENPDMNREANFDKLSKILKDISKEINGELADVFSLGGDLVDDSCSISEDFFIENNGSDKYSPEKIEKDKRYTRKRDMEWGETEDVDKYREEKAKREPEQFEMAKTIVFNKAIGKDYLVTRSSRYDDYANGVDNVIVDKVSGNAVCAFDEVRSWTADSEKLAEKEEKIVQAAYKEKGNELKYGITIENNQAVKKPMENIPLFYLGINAKDCKKLIKNISSTEEMSQAEKDFFVGAVKSLEKQAEFLQKLSIPEKTKESIKRFQASLEKIKSINI